jgi:ABC-type sugar transport system permease subunit
MSTSARPKRRGTLFILLTILPALAIITIFTLYPIAYALSASFSYFDFSNPNKKGFAGLANYVGVLENAAVRSSFTATTIFVVSSFLLVVGLALGSALLLNEKFRGVKYLQVIVLLPWAIPFVVAGLMWRWIYDSNYGVFNYVLHSLGIIPSFQAWFTQPVPAMAILIVSYAWSEFPISTLLILAGLQSVPKELYEAAIVDGAGAWARFKRVTWVWLKPILLIVFVFETLRALTVFDSVYVLTKGQPADATAVISYFIYRYLFTFFDVGGSSALSIVVLVVSVVLIYAYFKFLKVGSLELRGR